MYTFSAMRPEGTPMRRVLGKSLPLLGSAALTAWLLLRLDLSGLHAALANAAWLPLGVALTVLPAALGVRAWRWKYLFADEARSVTFAGSMKLLLIGQGLNLFLPANSGDLAKSYFGYRWGGHKERVVAVSILDKCMALAGAALLGVPFALEQGEYLLALLSVPLLGPFLCMLLFPTVARYSPLCRRCLEQLTVLLRNRFDFLHLLEHSRLTGRKIVVGLLVSAGGWAITYVQLYLCLRSVTALLSLTHVLVAAPLLTLVRLNPLAANGIGSDEAAMMYFFAEVQNPAAVVAAALLYRLITMVLPGLAGLLCLRGGGFHEKEREHDGT